MCILVSIILLRRKVYTIPQGLGIDNEKTEIKRFIHLLVYIVVPANATPGSQNSTPKYPRMW